MDTRAARRAAEKAARNLINNRTAPIGELGVAQAERALLEAEVVAAAGRGRQLVAAAEDEAARLLEHAQSAVRNATERYADLYSAATMAGWTPADLAALGFDSTSPHPRRASTRAQREAPAPGPSPEQSHVTVPEQHSRTAQ